MRVNKFVASASTLSRRAADAAIAGGRVRLNGQLAVTGQQVGQHDSVTLDEQALSAPAATTTIMLNKPAGYVVSRAGQSSKTVYDLLPAELHHLKPGGRLDKDSSGLLLLTSDGQLAHRLTHPSYQKIKVYEVEIDRPLTRQDFERLTVKGVYIGDGHLSRFQLVASSKQAYSAEAASAAKARQAVGKPAAGPCYFLPATCRWQATLAEGRNRQIRRTFAALNYRVLKLHRTQFGNYHLPASLKPGSFQSL